MLGAWYTADGATASASGTSMASPHVAGAAAEVLQGSPGASPAAVADALRQQATRGAGTGVYCYVFIFCTVPATPNVLLRTTL